MRQGRDVLCFMLHRGELHQHRKIDAGDDLHPIFLQECQADVRRCPAEHVGEDNHAIIGSDALQSFTDFFPRLVDTIGPFQSDRLDDSYFCFDLLCRAQQLMGEFAMRYDQRSDQITLLPIS